VKKNGRGKRRVHCKIRYAVAVGVFGVREDHKPIELGIEGIKQINRLAISTKTKKNR